MSSRLGNIVKGEDVLNNAKSKIEEILKDREYTAEEKIEIAEAVGVSAVKFSFLKSNPNKDNIFDLDESVSSDGFSAPYVMYSYARAKSILKEVPASFCDDKTGNFQVDELHDTEADLIKEISRLPEIINLSAENYVTNFIAEYSFELAQKFNAFYKSCQVLNETNEEKKKLRIGIISAFCATIETSLKLLGITPVEKM